MSSPFTCGPCRYDDQALGLLFPHNLPSSSFSSSPLTPMSSTAGNRSVVKTPSPPWILQSWPWMSQRRLERHPASCLSTGQGNLTMVRVRSSLCVSVSSAPKWDRIRWQTRGLRRLGDLRQRLHSPLTEDEWKAFGRVERFGVVRP